MQFVDFEERFVEVSDGEMFIRMAGSGPALLMVHGNPQTSHMWHRIAPRLAEQFTVLCPDIRGYGRSFKPDLRSDHENFSKRVMARDLAELMRELGHSEYFLCGHDRGARIGHRLALDYPQSVKKLITMEIIPTLEHFERADMTFGLGYYHWFWLAQPHPIPETFIKGRERQWFDFHTAIHTSRQTNIFTPEAYTEYVTSLEREHAVRSICEDYRAAATIDMEHDRASRESGQKLTMPVKVLWGEKGKLGKWYDPLEVWTNYCEMEVIGHSIDCGHYMAEEAPDDVYESVISFINAE